MRYWAFLSIPLSLAAGFSCDKLWSSSVVDCGRPGFPCPAGYSPDMPLADSDGGSSIPDGGAGDQGGPGAGDMGTSIPAGYTSVYTMSDISRTTLVGTSDGRVRIYSYNGAGNTFSIASQFTDESGVPIIGVWRGSLYGSGTPTNLTVVAPNTSRIYTHINGSAGSEITIGHIVNAMWSSQRNGQNNIPIYNNVKLYFAANGGKIIEADVISPSLAVSNISVKDLAVTSNINTVAGLQSGMMGSTPRTCTAIPCDVIWAAGDAGKLFGSDGTNWHPIDPVTGALGQNDRIFGIATARNGSSGTPPGTALGKGGLYLERPSGDTFQWKTVPSPPFDTTTMNALCYYDDNEAWAVGEGGAVYHYLSYMGPAAWTKVTIPNLGKNLSTVSFRAAHCAESSDDGTTSRNRRVTIVGSNNTLLFADDVSNMGLGYTWTLVE